MSSFWLPAQHSRVQHNHEHSVVQGYTAHVAELERSNKKTLTELADFKAESKALPNQGLTIKRLEAQMGQIKAQLQNQVNCIAFRLDYETRLSIPLDSTSTVRQIVTMTFIGVESNVYAIICRMASHASQALLDQEQVTSFPDQT